jgi:hypothetical protein
VVTIRWTSLVVALSLAHPPSASSQQPVQDPPRGVPPAVGSVRGEVFDSLIGARLEGANVRVRGTGLGTTTDRRGRFRLDSVPAGRVVLLVDHPALDSAGLSDLPTVVAVAAGRTTQVRLAVPSLRSLSGAACGRDPGPASGDSGIVFGAVRDAESRARLMRARVTVSWLHLERDRNPLVTRRVREVLTDSLGNYYACGVARGAELHLQTSAGSFSSGELSVEVGDRRVLRRDLSVSREAPAEEGDTGPVPRPGLAVLAGSVLSEAGQPLEAVLAGVPGGFGDAVTDATGRFVLADLPSGSRMLYVRRIGYSFTATVVELRNRDTTRVTLVLPALTVLDTLRVTASRWVRSELDDLERRMREHSPGHVLLGDELKTMGLISSVFRSFPALHTQPGRWAGEVTLYMEFGVRLCEPTVWIDGWPAQLEMLQGYQPADLLAVEVYRASETPLRYRDMNNCGAVLAWTRFLH